MKVGFIGVGMMGAGMASNMQKGGNELVVNDLMKDKTIEAILGAARSGRIGDGKIFISRVDEAIRIRNDERGETAL